MKKIVDMKRDQLELIRNGIFFFIASEFIDQVISYARAVDAIQEDVEFTERVTERIEKSKADAESVDIWNILIKERLKEE